MTFSPGYKYVEKFRRGIQLYMLESKDFILNFKLKNGNNQLASFNGHSINFRISNKEIYSF